MNRNTIIVGALSLAATTARDKNGVAPTAASPQGATSQEQTTPASVSVDSNPLPSDPRLTALQVSPDTGLIKFIKAADGKVIAEIDQDPASLGYGKPSREYVYAGDKVVGVTAYRYMRDQVEVSRTMVAYKPDGSVDAIKESTSYESPPQESR
jgi:hypothetical protein